MKRPQVPRVKLPHLKHFSIRKKYYFVVAEVRGKPYVDGWYATREEANKMAWRNLQGVVWHIEESDKKSLSLKTQETKHDILDSTGDIELAVQRAKHKI